MVNKVLLPSTLFLFLSLFIFLILFFFRLRLRLRLVFFFLFSLPQVLHNDTGMLSVIQTFRIDHALPLPPCCEKTYSSPLAIGSEALPKKGRKPKNQYRNRSARLLTQFIFVWHCPTRVTATELSYDPSFK